MIREGVSPLNIDLKWLDLGEGRSVNTAYVAYLSATFFRKRLYLDCNWFY